MTPRRIALLLSVVLLAAVCALGPRPVVQAPDWSAVEARLPRELAALDDYLQAEEARAPGLTPGTERRIVWFDGERRTKRALVYLHGFSATRQETAPLAEEVARDLGANLYEARLRGHGQAGEALGHVSAQDWLSDAAEALAIGRQLGEEVVILGTSTGATLALWLATRPAEERAGLSALVLLSPNLGPKASEAGLLTLPWAEVLLPVLIPERSWTPRNPEHARYWTSTYPLGALFPMQALVEEVQATDPARLTVPTLFVYNPNDDVIDAAKVDDWFARLPLASKARIQPQPAANEDAHVLAGRILSPSQTEPLRAQIVQFLSR